MMTYLGQANDETGLCEGQPPKGIGILQKFVFNISIPLLFWHRTFIVESEKKNFNKYVIV